MVNEREFHPRRVQTILWNAWTLRDAFHVMGKDGKFYVFYFEKNQDMEYIQANNLWALQGALMHFTN